MERSELSMDFVTGKVSVGFCESITDTEMQQHWQRRINKYSAEAKSPHPKRGLNLTEECDEYRLVHWSNLPCNMWNMPPAEADAHVSISKTCD